MGSFASQLSNHIKVDILAAGGSSTEHYLNVGGLWHLGSVQPLCRLHPLLSGFLEYIRRGNLQSLLPEASFSPYTGGEWGYWTQRQGRVFAMELIKQDFQIFHRIYECIDETIMEPRGSILHVDDPQGACGSKYLITTAQVECSLRLHLSSRYSTRPVDT